MDRYSDDESKRSLPEVLSRDQIDEFNHVHLIDRRANIELNSVDRRFLKMSRQISDLTSLVLSLTETISSTNRESNGLLTTSNANETRSS